jgi:hypothetical protein
MGDGRWAVGDRGGVGAGPGTDGRSGRPLGAQVPAMAGPYGERKTGGRAGAFFVLAPAERRAPRGAVAEGSSVGIRAGRAFGAAPSWVV